MNCENAIVSTNLARQIRMPATVYLASSGDLCREWEQRWTRPKRYPRCTLRRKYVQPVAQCGCQLPIVSSCLSNKLAKMCSRSFAPSPAVYSQRVSEKSHIMWTRRSLMYGASNERQTGQHRSRSMRARQCGLSQRHICPQGSTTVTTGRSMQMQHIPFAKPVGCQGLFWFSATAWMAASGFFVGPGASLKYLGDL